jgi:hypothetical protein
MLLVSSVNSSDPCSCGLGFMLFFPVSYCIMIYAYFILIW